MFGGSKSPASKLRADANRFALLVRFVFYSLEPDWGGAAAAAASAAHLLYNIVVLVLLMFVSLTQFYTATAQFFFCSSAFLLFYSSWLHLPSFFSLFFSLALCNSFIFLNTRKNIRSNWVR